MIKINIFYLIHGWITRTALGLQIEDKSGPTSVAPRLDILARMDIHYTNRMENLRKLNIIYY